MIFDKIEEQMKDERETTSRRELFLKNNRPAIVVVAKSLRKMEDNVLSFWVDAISLNISMTGDKHVLQAAFGELRKLGLKPRVRPVPNDPSYNTYFDSEDPNSAFQVWFSFSSTSCRRVKVGTEMKEVDVYETVCE